MSRGSMPKRRHRVKALTCRPVARSVQRAGGAACRLVAADAVRLPTKATAGHYRSLIRGQTRPLCLQSMGQSPVSVVQPQVIRSIRQLLTGRQGDDTMQPVAGRIIEVGQHPSVSGQ